MTPRQLAYFLEHLPLVEARRHWSLARLNADLREFMMPRYTEPDPDQKEAAKPPRARDPWRVDELLPWFAKLPEEPIPPEAAESLVAAFDHLPEWARTVAPIEAATAALTA